jgi:transcriptional regulator with XRE-family HTH domain
MSSGLKREVGLRLREARQKKGASQQEVIDYLQGKLGLKLKRSSISNYETGVSFPSIDVLYAIAIYLDISVDFLLGLSKAQGGNQGKKITSQFLIQQDEFTILPLVQEIARLKQLLSIFQGLELPENERKESLKSFQLYAKQLDITLSKFDDLSQNDLMQFQEETEGLIRNYQNMRRELFEQFYVDFINDFHEGKIEIKRSAQKSHTKK